MSEYITIKRSELEQALETLEGDPNAMIAGAGGHWDFKCNLAITALRAALAQQADPVEPVGRVVSANCEYATVQWLKQTSDVGGGDPKNSWSWPIAGDAVYTAPPKREDAERKSRMSFDEAMNLKDRMPKSLFRMVDGQTADTIWLCAIEVAEQYHNITDPDDENPSFG